MKKIAIFTFATLFSAAAFAQKDTLNAVVKVENEYNPVIVKANKQSFTPQIEAIANSTPLNLIFSKKATPFERFISDRDLRNLLPKQEAAYNGYARLGYGNRNNTDIKAAYNLDLGTKDKINMFASLTGYKCDIEALNDGDWASRLFNTWLAADYSHRFEKLTLGVQGSINSNVFNYQPSFALPDATDKQNSSSYHIGANIVSNLAGPLSYNANAGYRLNSRKYSNGVKEGISENHFIAGGSLTYEISNEQLRSMGVAADIDAFTYNDNLKPEYYEYDNYVSMRLNPFMNFRFDDWKLRLGIHADLLTANGKKAAFAPDVKFEGPIAQNMTFYATATGGNNLNTFATLSELSPYWSYSSGNAQYTPTYKVFDVETGIRMTFEPLAIYLYTGYDYQKYNLLPTIALNHTTGFIYTDFAQTDTRTYFLGGKLSYDYGGWITATADARYNKWSCDGEEQLLLFTPMLEANLKARARICEGLYADLGYNYARYTKADGERIKDMHNLNMAVSYQFHKQFRAYIQGDNLLNRKHFSYAGYLSRGANVLLGLEYSF